VSKLKLFFIFSCLILISLKQANADGVSPYLPLKTDPLIELQIERLVSISHMPVLSKPYHIVTLVNYLKKIEHSHPLLFHRITEYIKRYKQQSAITHLSTTIAASDNKDSTLANNRGIKMDDLSQTSAFGFYQFNKYVIGNLGGTIVNGNKIIPTNTYLSFGYEYLQIDLGYREHWLSPMQESASLISTNSKSSLSITLSNVKPITSWNAKYEFSLAQLEEMDGIHFEDSTSSGKPLLMSMHLSIQPLSWWTIGANRTFQFGGGDRSTGLSDIWKAIIDPVNSDNCGSGETECEDSNEEVGNQIASISNKFDFAIEGFPISFLHEYAGEDTKNHKNYQLGNLSQTFGIFFPYINKDISLYAEHTKLHSAWYVHHIYDEGYRNDDVVMGHWWGNNKESGDDSPGDASLIRLNWDMSQKFHLETLFRTSIVDSSNTEKYSRANEINISLRQVYKNGFINYSLMVGSDIYGKSFYRAAVGYNW